jgi:hypothetical protein
MYEYKSVTLVDFFFEEEIKLRRKEFEVENTEKRAINFMNLFLNYYSSKGWELDSVHKIDKSLDDAVYDFAKNKSVVSSMFNKMLTPTIIGGYEFYIFKRIAGVKTTNTSESNTSLENTPAVKSQQSKSISDESLDENSLIKLNKIVNPLIDKLKSVGYVVTDSKITMSTNYWRVTYPSNGSFCELNSVKELQDFAENF